MDPDDRDPSRAHLARFATLVNGGETFDLDEAALVMSAILQPGLDVVEWLTALDEIAASCPSPTRTGVVDHVCGTLEFTGDPTTYSDWRNSCLDRVIQSRRGIPITLSVVVIEVARRLGVDLVGIGMPAHFLVGDPDDPNWFVDPFGGGTVLDRNGCRSLLERLSRGQVVWHDRHLQPTPPRGVITRMTNNLRAGFAQRGDLLRHALVMRMRMTIPELDSERADALRALAVLN